MSYIRDLANVIWKTHGAVAEHIQSIPVKETHQGEVVWDGVVEVFRIVGHPKTDVAYAWSHKTNNPEHPLRSVTVLKLHPIRSAQDAVRAAIMQEFKSLESEES